MVTGTDDGFSYLEFGSISANDGRRKLYDFRTNDQAYDWLMHSRYSNDIYSYHKMLLALEDKNIKATADVFSANIHHSNDLVVNMSKLFALSVVTGNSFFELGQTLFGCIEGMQVCASINEIIQPEVKALPSLLDVEWFGLDISEFFNLFAKKMHQEFKIFTSSTAADIPPHVSVAFAKGITLLYAVSTEEALLEFMMKGDITLLDYSFSIDQNIITQVGTGKTLCYLNKESFIRCYQKLKSASKDIWVRGNAGVKEDDKRLFYFEGFVATTALAKHYIDKQTAWHKAVSSINVKAYKQLVPQRSEDYWRWYRLDEVIEV